MEPVVAETAFGQPVHVGGRYVRAEAPEVGEPGVVQDDGDDVGRSGGGLGVDGRHQGVPLEGERGLLFGRRHFASSPSATAVAPSRVADNRDAAAGSTRKCAGPNGLRVAPPRNDTAVTGTPAHGGPPQGNQPIEDGSNRLVHLHGQSPDDRRRVGAVPGCVVHRRAVVREPEVAAPKDFRRQLGVAPRGRCTPSRTTPRTRGSRPSGFRRVGAAGGGRHGHRGRTLRGREKDPRTQ